MKINPRTKPPKEIDSGFDTPSTKDEENEEPIPHTKPTVLFDEQTIRELNWEAFSN